MIKINILNLIRLQLKTIIQKIGLDKAILWGILNKMISAIKGIVLIFFMMKFLTVVEQGLWYTFISLGALTIFAELGFTNIIAQFISHEFANLSSNKKNEIIGGPTISIERFFSIINFSIKLYSIVIPLAILILLVVGFIYFDKKINTIYWAWVLYSISGAINLVVSLFQSIYQGMDKVKEIQINLFLLALFNTLFTCIFLFLKFNIFSLAIASFLSSILSLILLYQTAPFFWKQAITSNRKYCLNVSKELLPLQWRYAISWISGYFIFYLIVPATNKFIGSQAAGQLGLTTTLVALISGASSNWVFSKIPKFNILVAQGNRIKLDSLFFNSCYIAILIQIIGSLVLLVILTYINKFNLYSNRFLPVGLTIYLLLYHLLQSCINYIAIYLRAHKEEPFVTISIVNAVFMCFAIFYILSKFSLTTFMIWTNIFMCCIVLPLTIMLFNKKRNSYI